MWNPCRSHHIARLIVIIMLVFTVCHPVLIDTAVIRSEYNDKEDVPKRYCYDNTVCGWAVYERDLRSIEYYLKNTCECRESYKCLRAYDDLFESVYVYHCRENMMVDDIEFLKDAN